MATKVTCNVTSDGIYLYADTLKLFVHADEIPGMIDALRKPFRSCTIGDNVRVAESPGDVLETIGNRVYIVMGLERKKAMADALEKALAEFGK